MQALWSFRFAAFVRDVAAAVRMRIPGRCAEHSDLELLDLVDAAISKAARYNITHAEDVILFVDLVVAHGLDFDECDAFAWARPVLASSAMGGATKMAVVFGRLPARLWPESVAPVEPLP